MILRYISHFLLTLSSSERLKMDLLLSSCQSCHSDNGFVTGWSISQFCFKKLLFVYLRTTDCCCSNVEGLEKVLHYRFVSTGIFLCCSMKTFMKEISGSSMKDRMLFTICSSKWLHATTIYTVTLRCTNKPYLFYLNVNKENILTCVNKKWDEYYKLMDTPQRPYFSQPLCRCCIYTQSVVQIKLKLCYFFPDSCCVLCCSNLHAKTSELTTQVNTLHTLVTSDHNKMNNLVQHDQTINRQEVSTLINLQQQLSSKVQEVR